MRLSNSPDIIFKTTTSSEIMKNAIKRYKQLIFHGGTSESKCRSQAVEISTICIVLLSDNEVLSIDTNYDYELTINTDANDATITASSVFGVMYV